MTNQRFYLFLLILIYIAVCGGIFIVFDATHRAHGAELEDCKGGCADIVTQEVALVNMRRSYSRENLGARSYVQPFLPPAKYDFEPRRRYIVQRVTERTIGVVCPAPLKGHVILACAYTDTEPCQIFILDDITLKSYGWNYNIVLHHEQAHCNGWPENHPGMERPTQ